MLGKSVMVEPLSLGPAVLINIEVSSSQMNFKCSGVYNCTISPFCFVSTMTYTNCPVAMWCLSLNTTLIS